MLSSISEDVNEEGYRERSTRARGVESIRRRVYSKLMRWKDRQILQFFFVTKVSISFFSLLNGFKKN